MSRCYFLFFSFYKALPNCRGTLTRSLGMNLYFLSIWVLEVSVLFWLLVSFVSFNTYFLTDCILISFSLPGLIQAAQLQAFYSAVRLNRVSSRPLDYVLLKVILHLDCENCVFSRVKS